MTSISSNTPFSSRSAEGTIEIFGGLRGPYRSWAAAPHHFLEEWTVADVRYRNGCDGVIAWEQLGAANTPRTLYGEAHARAARRAVFTPAPPESDDTEYADWRTVDGLLLPHRVTMRAPDRAATLYVHRYRHDVTLPATGFGHPLAAHHEAATEVTLATLPTRIYKVPDGLLPDEIVRFWGVPHPPMERWLLHLMVRERFGRHVEPLHATIEMYAGDARVRTETYEPTALQALRRHPASRFFPRDELYHLRHRFVEPTALAVDRMRYTLTVAAPGGDPVTAPLDIPLARYTPRTRLRCPLRGPFVVAIGHEPPELSHTYEWSQQFACDLVPLIEAGATGEVLAPADGVVLRARDDVPDDMPPHDYLTLADPLYAIGGNGVVLDHETNEYSMLFHFRHGSVRVAPGDRVRQGDVLGIVGSAGTPGYVHLHYHLQAGPEFFAADGLPIGFDNVVLAHDWLGPMRRGVPVPVPVRGPTLTTI